MGPREVLEVLEGPGGSLGSGEGIGRTPGVSWAVRGGGGAVLNPPDQKEAGNPTSRNQVKTKHRIPCFFLVMMVIWGVLSVAGGA